MYILGVSSYYHDSAACLVRDGDIVAAAQEERFTRKKHDPRLSYRAVEYRLKAKGIRFRDVQNLVFEVSIISPAMMEKKSKISPCTTLIPNRVDYEGYAMPAHGPMNIASIPHPRIGYTGFLKK